MKFNLTLDCDNAAFKDDNDNEHDIHACLMEIASILDKTITHIKNGTVARTLYDSNGNVCGRFTLGGNQNGL